MEELSNWIIAISTFVTMLAIISQGCIANKARKDNLFKIRLDHYGEIVDFLHHLISTFNFNHKAIIGKQLSEKKLRFNIYDISGSKKFLAQVEYLFGDKIVNYIKDKYELGEVHTLGKINRISNEFELNLELESMFAPFFKD
jgi:hypothetical protein